MPFNGRHLESKCSTLIYSPELYCHARKLMQCTLHMDNNNHSYNVIYAALTLSRMHLKVLY